MSCGNLLIVGFCSVLLFLTPVYSIISEENFIPEEIDEFRRVSSITSKNQVDKVVKISPTKYCRFITNKYKSKVVPWDVFNNNLRVVRFHFFFCEKLKKVLKHIIHHPYQ